MSWLSLWGLVECVAVTVSPGAWSEKAASSPYLTQIPDFRAMAKEVSPAVVSIQVLQKPRAPSKNNDSRNFFYRLLPGNPSEDFGSEGLGSGFVIHKDGLILTNFHVIDGADDIQIKVGQADGAEKSFAAQVVGTAPDYDIALLKTAQKIAAPIAYLGNSDQVVIGDWVMAIGNPFGLSHSVSVGIISAKDRRDVMPSGRRGLYDFLQTDASINPGNSGGPLVNTRGEVIGINSAINAAGSGIGFAIPINMVKGILPDLQNKGKFGRSWIGIRIQEISPDLAHSYGLPQAAGALVSQVVPDSPAQHAGLKEGDVVLKFDGRKVNSSNDLPLFASMAGVGRNVVLNVWRERKEINLSLRLSEYPEEIASARAPQTNSDADFGLDIADITPELRGRFALPQSSGVVVRGLTPQGAAAKAGIRPGDIILSLNGENVVSAQQFVENSSKIPLQGVLRLQVRRDESRLFLAVRRS